MLSILKFSKIFSDALIPIQSTQGSNGIDLFSYDTKEIKPMNTAIISTGIKIYFNNNYYGMIASRSGKAFNYRLFAFNGVIDYDYNDEIKVLLINFSNKIHKINKGDKIAQLLILRNEIPGITKNNKKHKGFGSTDNKN